MNLHSSCNAGFATTHGHARRRGLLSAALLLIAGMIAAVPAMATSATDAFMVGTLKVQRHGEQGSPVILIPGLGSGAWVWQDTIARLQDKHVVYAVTLAGFDGVPAPARKTGLMDQADASLLQLIDEQHIDKPVLIGHSLGGTLAIRFATEHADRLSGVVAVDGMPIFPGAERMDAAQRKATAAGMGAQMAQATPEQFKAQQVGYMQVMGVLDAADAERYGAMQARSDAATVAQYMTEDYALDLRPALPKISVPLLEISPYNTPDFAAAAEHSGQPLIDEAQKTAYYRQLLAGTPQLEVVSVSPARHFVMLDQPQRFHEIIEAFLAKAGK